MKKLQVKKIIKRRMVCIAGCGRNWDNLCGARQ